MEEHDLTETHVVEPLDEAAHIVADAVCTAPGVATETIEDMWVWQLRLPFGVDIWAAMERACALGLVDAVVGTRSVFYYPAGGISGAET